MEDEGKMALLLGRSTEGLDREVRDSVDEYIMEKAVPEMEGTVFVFWVFFCRFGS